MTAKEANDVIDREKVIKGLEEAEIMLIQAVDRGGEMAVMEAFKCLNRVTDALTLLKEQAAVEPKLDAFGHPYCPKCKILVYETWKFCPHCGKQVKLYFK